MRQSSRNFRYRNRAGAWLDFKLEGLALAADGAFELVSVPRADPAVRIDAAPAPGAIAVSSSGEVFFTQAGVIAKRTCTGEVEETGIEAPRVMAVSARRGTLLALYADRLVLFDLPGVREAETWYGFDDAQGLALDSSGRVYIADLNGVRRYSFAGQPDASFLIDSIAPLAVAVGRERLFALEGGAVHVFDLDGNLLSDRNLETTVSALAADAASVYVGST